MKDWTEQEKCLLSEELEHSSFPCLQHWHVDRILGMRNVAIRQQLAEYCNLGIGIIHGKVMAIKLVVNATIRGEGGKYPTRL